MTGANVLLLAVEEYKIGQERVPIPRRRLVGAHAPGKVTKQGHVMRNLAQVFTHIIAVKQFFSFCVIVAFHQFFSIIPDLNEVKLD